MVIQKEKGSGRSRAPAPRGRPRWVGLQQRVDDALTDGRSDDGTDADTNDGAHADASCADAVG